MNILFISHYPALYGANRSLLNLIEGLIPKGVNPMVICTKEGDLTLELENLNIPYYSVPFHYWCGIKPKKRRNVFKYIIQIIKYKRQVLKITEINKLAAFKVANEFKSFKPDLVYSNSSVTGLGIEIAGIMNISHIWHFREFGKLHYNYDFYLSEKQITKEFNKSTAIIGISQAIKSFYQPITNVDISVIYNGVIWENRIQKISDVNIIEDRVIFGIIGVIHPNKGQDEAIKAFEIVQKNHPNTKLIIAGNGPFESKLKKYVLSRHIKNVEFMGYVKDPFKFFKKIDVTLVCSRFEAMGRATAEAMAMGKPVIGFNDSGTAELVINHKTGLLYDDGYNELAIKMTMFIENPQMITSFGKEGQKIAKEKFTIEAYSKSIYKIIQSVLKKKSVQI